MSENKRKRPQMATIRKVVEHLEELGLCVYGECMDLDTFQEFGGCMDYDVEDIAKLRKGIDKGLETWRDE